jgi:phage tail sheath gpL-like
VEALITTYQENLYGAPDTAYLYANTPCTISYVAQSLIAYLTSKFPRHKLADDDGPTPPAGARIATPSLVKGRGHQPSGEPLHQ